MVDDDGSGRVAGFYQPAATADGKFLEDLWVEPASFGCGWSELLIESDPGAETFYLNRGATRIGERRSGAGRMLPLLRYDLAGKS